jgi:hypothetical protein
VARAPVEEQARGAGEVRHRFLTEAHPSSV